MVAEGNDSLRGNEVAHYQAIFVGGGEPSCRPAYSAQEAELWACAASPEKAQPCLHAQRPLSPLRDGPGFPDLPPGNRYASHADPGLPRPQRRSQWVRGAQQPAV